MRVKKEHQARALGLEQMPQPSRQFALDCPECSSIFSLQLLAWPLEHQ